MVWRFAFGLGHKNQNGCGDKVSSRVVCLDNKVIDNFVSDLKNERLLLCHCALESKDKGITSRVAAKVSGQFLNDSTYRSIAHTPFDCVAVCNVLRQTSCQSVTLDLSGCGLESKQLEELTRILSHAAGELLVEKLVLVNNKLTNKGVSDLFVKASASFHSLDRLALDGSNIHDIIPSFVQNTHCHSLRLLSLSDNSLGVSGIQSLERAVQAGVLDRLRLLHLSNTLTNDADINGALLTTLMMSIACHCYQLEEVDLSQNNLGVPGASALGESFPLLINEKREFDLELKAANFTSEAMEAFCDSVVNKTPLAILFYTTRSCKCTLRLNDNPLGWNGLLAIFKMLKSTTYKITALYVENTKLAIPVSSDIQDHGIQNAYTSDIVHLGPVVSNLQYLSLVNNDFSGDGVLILAKCIQICQSVEFLFNDSCFLTSSEIVNLLDYLQSFGTTGKSLRWWHLSNNFVDDRGMTAMVKHLPMLFPNLEVVVYDQNPVSEDTKKEMTKCLNFIRKTRWANDRAELEARRSAALTKWKETCSPPHTKELLQEFFRMWDQLLRRLVCLAEEFVSKQVVLDLNIKSPQPTSSQDESVPSGTKEQDEPVGHHHPTTNESACPTVQSSKRMDQNEAPIPELSLSVLEKELTTLTKPIQFGIYLGIPQDRLEVIEQDHRHDTDGQKIALFQYIAKNCKTLGITWTSIAEALHNIHDGNLSLSIKDKYCNTRGQ